MRSAEPGKARVSPAASGPPCPHAPRCVPCPYRGLPYREQLRRKRRRVEEALGRHLALADTRVEDVVGSRDLFGYRSVAKLAVRSDRVGTLRAGVYEPGSHRLTDAAGCAVHHPAVNDVVAATLREAAALDVSAYDEERGRGELRYLVLRRSALYRRVQLVLVSAEPPSPKLRELARRLVRRTRAVGGIIHNHNPERGNVILGRRFATLRPPAELVERVGFLKLQASPGSFLQANLWTARRIYETALAWADPRPTDVAVDLFCGVGPLAFHIAARAARVIGVEDSATAVRDARANQRRNGFHNVRFEEGRAEEVLPRLARELSRLDLATLNPTRKGVAPAVIDATAALSPSRLVYVSCDVETLARDLARLARVGYATRRVLPFDMLPQTEHVEVVALAERIA